MKKAFLNLILMCHIIVLPAQMNIVKLWDYGYGGTANDYMNSFQQTADGGFIMAGESASGVSGDKTEDLWGIYDFWILKLNSNGLKEWDKRFGGGGLEGLTEIRQLPDGGYLLGGFSGSGISGDKTEASRGDFDYWVVKTDGNGNKLWDKRYGGPSGDYLWAMTLTKDGGALLGGYSESGIGGDKTEPNRGIYEDYWVVKIDSLGNKQWDKTFGGSIQDFCEDVIQTNDGGYLLGGIARSDSSGDKSEDNWGTGSDYWIIKLDSLGNKQWDRTLGTSSDDNVFLKCFQKNNGNYFSIGGAYAGISGNKSIQKGGAWFVELDNTGSIKNEFSITGPYVSFLKELEDGGFVLGGSSGEDTSADKTEFGLGTLFIKTDSSGNRIWDKTVVANAGGYATIVGDDCFAIGGGMRLAPNGYQTALNHDPTYQTDDFWAMKFCLEPTGIGPLTPEGETAMQIHPNPASDFVQVEIETDMLNAYLKVFDVTGKLVIEKKTNNEKTVLDISALNKGMYVVVASKDEKTARVKLIIE